jgi:hypothetical protein
MSYEKKVKDLMIPLEDYPHIPYWFTLNQAVIIVREAAIKYEGSFEPRAVLVFDEKYHLLGILTLKDIVRGLEADLLKGSGGSALSWQELVFTCINNRYIVLCWARRKRPCPEKLLSPNVQRLTDRYWNSGHTAALKRRV